MRNLWDQVDDFKWLKAEQSPNWTVMPKEERLSDDTWLQTLSGEGPVDEALALVGRISGR